jgi:diaminopimelate epimerase
MNSIRYTVMSGTGNRFAVVDGFADPVPDDPSALARAMCAPAPEGGLEPRPDGLLLVKPARGEADCAMEVYNADGSRPQTCGNGLRCVAKLVADRKHVAGERFVIRSDARPCAAEVEREHGRVNRARIHMGDVRLLAARETIDGHVVARVDVGNPHCVLVVDDERSAPVSALGARLERHSAFPQGTNVEFLARRAGALYLRVWERGVGETLACGSGACAAAAVAVDRGLASWPVRLELLGGVLDLSSDGRSGVWLSGAVEEHGSGVWSFAGASSARERSRPSGAC